MLSCYSSAAQGFTEDHLRMFELLAASLAAAVASVANPEAAATLPRLPAAAPRRTGTSNGLVMTR